MPCHVDEVDDQTIHVFRRCPRAGWVEGVICECGEYRSHNQDGWMHDRRRHDVVEWYACGDGYCIPRYEWAERGWNWEAPPVEPPEEAPQLNVQEMLEHFSNVFHVNSTTNTPMSFQFNTSSHSYNTIDYIDTGGTDASVPNVRRRTPGSTAQPTA